jgi:hypothetical protein
MWPCSQSQWWGVSCSLVADMNSCFYHWTYWTDHLSGCLSIVSSEDGKVSSSKNLCFLSASANQKSIVCFVISIRPFFSLFAWNSLSPTAWVLVEFYVQNHYETFIDILVFWLNPDRYKKHFMRRSKYIVISSSNLFTLLEASICEGRAESE